MVISPKYTLLMASLVVFSTVSVAENNLFSGFKAGLQLNASQNKIKYQDNYMNNVSSDKTEAAFQFITEYSLPVAGDFMATAGLTYDFLNHKSGSVHYLNGANSDKITTKLKNHFSVYLAPGYIVTPQLMVYGKLGYHFTKTSHTDAGAHAGNKSLNHNGIGYGLGLAAIVAPNVEAGLEAQYIRYNKKTDQFTSNRPQTVEYGISLKYRF